MAKCAACGKFLSPKGGAACVICKNKFHLACAHLPESKKVSSGWKCQDCKGKTPKCSKASLPVKAVSGDCCESTPSPGSTITSFEDVAETGDCERNDQLRDTVPSSQMDVGQELRLFRSEIRKMWDELKSEIRQFHHELTDFRETLTTCNQRVDKLESRLDALESRQSGTPSESIVSQLENTVALLKQELNSRDQDLLSSDLEISNLPEDSGENVLHTVELVAKKLGVSLEARDIVFAERVGLRSSEVGEGNEAGGAGAARARVRPVVVRLARRGLRDELLRSARVRRGATSADLGIAAPSRRFFLNERLTRNNKLLFYRARQAANHCGWKYTWTKRGRILTKQDDGKRTYSIQSEADLERVFSSEMLKDSSN